MSDQARAPYLEALLDYTGRDPGRFHVPGHKGGPGADPGLREAIGERALAMDIPALTEGIDTGVEPTPFEQAQRLAADALAAMFADARSLWESAAADEGCSVEADRIWAIEPVPFHAGLVSAARTACAEVAGSDRGLPSGALHDAAEVARVVPTAMVLSSSAGGVSHAPDEATPDADLRAAIEAFGALARRVVAEVAL